jgi:hypothetical protein
MTAITVAMVLGNGVTEQATTAVRDGLTRTEAAARALLPTGWGGPPTLRLVEERVGEALGEQLDQDIGELLVKGWSSFRELIKAAERTRDDPGSPEDVMLVQHDITTDFRPSVEVLLNGVPVATLRFTLTIGLRLDGVIAVVERGKLAALRAGELSATAKIELDGQELTSGAYRCYAGLAVPLGNGVLLVSPAPTTTPSPVATPRAFPGDAPGQHGRPNGSLPVPPRWTRYANPPVSRPAVVRPSEPSTLRWGSRRR